VSGSEAVDNLAEWRLGEWLLIVYSRGFSVFHGAEAEFTTYDALLAVVLSATALLLLWRRVRPGTRWHCMLLLAALLGAAGMCSGVSTASRLSSVGAAVAGLGALLGLPAFGLYAVLWVIARPRSLAPRRDT